MSATCSGSIVKATGKFRPGADGAGVAEPAAPEKIELHVRAALGMPRIKVMDRGPGMNDSVLTATD